MDDQPLVSNDGVLDQNNKDKNFKINLIIYIILGVIIIGLVIVIVLLITSEKEKIIEEKIIYPPNNESQEINWNFFGEFKKNISYSKNDKIENTFKKGGKNYDPEIGDINNGENYEKNERNVYDLYIPYSALLNKDNYNGIILFVHGGSWIEGSKESFEEFCKIYGELGYITATMGYTVLHGIYPNTLLNIIFT